MGKDSLTATDIAPRRLGGCRVLVVEGGEDSAACLTALLRLNGFDARATHSGKDALHDLVKLKPRAVLLDLDLPDMDACDVIRSIRAKKPACAVIVLTAHTDLAHRTAAISAGANDYILKPAEPVALVKAIMSHCGSA